MNNTVGCDNKYDPECLGLAPTDFAPWEMDYAILIPRYTGGLSSMSSILIVYIILRSEKRLSSIYHRIMFGMSLADVCSSTAMALTSLPMPSYMLKEEIFGYKWAGTRLGNTNTCNAQGFFIFFGMGCMFTYNAMLCVYYACAISLTMSERNIKKYVEPIIHSLPLLAGLVFSVPALFNKMYNPAISDYAVSAWCGPVTYPFECNRLNKDVDCIRGTPEISLVIRIIIAASIVSIFCIISFSLGSVVWKVIITDRMIEHISKLYVNRGHPEMTKVMEKHRNTKVVVLQAFTYIGAFLVGAIFPLSVGFMDLSRKDHVDISNLFEKITLVFLPLQGFFNFVIFVSFKVYNYRRVCHNMSICQVIGLLFCTSAPDPCFISRLSVVRGSAEQDDGSDNDAVEDGEARRQQVYYYDVEMKDESNDELHHRLGLIRNYSHQHDFDDPPRGCNAAVSPTPISSGSEGLLLGNVSSDSASLQKGYEEEEESWGSKINPSGTSGLLQCLSSDSRNSSFISNDSVLYRNLSVDENFSIDYQSKKKYYHVQN